MSEEIKPRQVKCPQCKSLSLYSLENPFRPFCSERCRTLDIGAWADEAYRVPVTGSSSSSLTVADSENPDEYED